MSNSRYLSSYDRWPKSIVTDHADLPRVTKVNVSSSDIQPLKSSAPKVKTYHTRCKLTEMLYSPYNTEYMLIIDALFMNESRPFLYGRGRQKSCSGSSLAPFALTLRGPSGGHCVGLSGRQSLTTVTTSHAGGPKGPQRVTLSRFFYLEAPRSGPRRAPGGSEQREREMVCYTTFDDPFRTVATTCLRAIL